jgi:CheY-like chemotaxis protein
MEGRVSMVRTDYRSTGLAGRFAVLAAPATGDLLPLHEDDDTAPTEALPPWGVLIVDDDRDVHDATRLALEDQLVRGRPVHLLHAYSAAQASELLQQQAREIDLILLDIIMETPEAGLELARAVRADPRLDRIKVLVRTGQPGVRPDDAARRLPGIDGYLAKAGITRAALLHALDTLLAPLAG